MTASGGRGVRFRVGAEPRLVEVQLCELDDAPGSHGVTLRYSEGVAFHAQDLAGWSC